MSIKIRNDYPVDPNSPKLEISRGEGKNKSTITVLPQESAPLGEGDLTIKVVHPPKDEETAGANEAEIKSGR